MKPIIPIVASLCLLTFAPRETTAGDVMIGGDHDVETKYDIPYFEGEGADARKHKLDLFLPKGQKDFPVLIFIHGGGWTTGDRKLYGSVGSIFARNGIGTAVISYRLTPMVMHPGHIQDVARAFAWVHKNIAKYGGKTDQIYVTGQSAGGHLAALLGTNESYLKAESLTLKDIKGVIPISGIYLFPPGRMTRIIGEGEEAAASASPTKHVTGKEPPFLILYAERDFPTCDSMSKEFCAALKKENVEATCIRIDDRNHISIMFRLMVSESDPATQALLKFIAKHSGIELTPLAKDRGKPKFAQ